MAGALVAALKDGDNRVKFFAAQSLGKLKYAAAAPALLAALKANADKDEYLRHALVMGLVGGNNTAALSAAATDRSRSVRLGVILALRRLGSPEVQRFLADSDPYLVREAAIAINDAPIVAAYPALAALLEKSTGNEPIALRAINAHFRLGGVDNAAALARFAALPAAPAKLRVEALEQLGNWETPPARDRLVGIFRPLTPATRAAAVARDALAPVAAALLAPAVPAEVQTAAMAELGQAPARIARSNFASAAYWTIAQLVAHHTVGGCNLQPGDLFGTGTLSGPGEGEGGSMLELTEGGKRALELPGGETRTFLQDGDTVILKARCERAGARSIGFGDCRGTVMPAP